MGVVVENGKRTPFHLFVIARPQAVAIQGSWIATLRSQ
jgi:hypothetical protein